eukprot:XP_001691760.1 predicted protein [Chlamydomonas reinhardtii]
MEAAVEDLRKKTAAWTPLYYGETRDRAEAVMATIKFYQLLLFRTDVLEVRKVVSPWAVFAAWSGVDFKKLKKLYRATAKRQGLVHIASKDALTLRGDVYTVDLIPAGFVHRDLRWDNFACSPASPRRWFLLDLETCAPADQSPPPTFEPAGWQSGTTLVHGLYTRASDLYQLWGRGRADGRTLMALS